MYRGCCVHIYTHRDVFSTYMLTELNNTHCTPVTILTGYKWCTSFTYKSHMFSANPTKTRIIPGPRLQLINRVQGVCYLAALLSTQ